MGSPSTVEAREDAPVGSLLSKVMPEDLLKYGLIPEFVGRLPIIVALDALDEKALVRILMEPKNVSSSSTRGCFRRTRSSLSSPTRAGGRCSESAHPEDRARGLRTIIEEILLDVMYDIPSQETVRQCVISRDVIEGKRPPMLVTRNDRDRTPGRSLDRSTATKDLEESA